MKIKNIYIYIKNISSYIKNISSYILLALMLLFFVSFPSEVLNASREGMGLWLNTLLPSLLPFLIVTGVLLQIRISFPVSKMLRGFSEKLFGLSVSGLYCLFLGLLCGYPMGAKLCSDFYSYGKISRREANYLLTFGSCASPAFFTNYILMYMLDNRIPAGRIILPFLICHLFSMLVFRFFVYKNQTIRDMVPSSSEKQCSPKKETPRNSSLGTIIDVSIMNGFETITRLGGYILLFSVISAMLIHFWPFTDRSSVVLLGFTELITGLHALKASDYPFQMQYMLSMAMACFGGLCILFQIHSVLHKDLSIRIYLLSKLLQTAILMAVLFFFQIT